MQIILHKSKHKFIRKGVYRSRWQNSEKPQTILNYSSQLEDIGRLNQGTSELYTCSYMYKKERRGGRKGRG
jgi:hypothetical protein